MKSHKALTAILFFALMRNAAFGVTVFLSPQKDNSLYEDSGGQLSNGQGIYLFTGLTGIAGLRRGLIAFDLTGIPANATIVDATLSMFLSTPHENVAAVNISLSKALHDWGEGASDAGEPGGQGIQAETNDATWLNTFYETSFWATPGGDFSPMLSATTTVSKVFTTYTWSGSGLLADVQSWVSTPASNFGWVILANEIDAGSAQRLNSRESSSNRPQLTITYQPSSETPTPSPTPTATATATATPTASPTPTATSTASPTPTATSTPTATATPAVTPTPSPVATPAPTRSTFGNISTRLRVETGNNVLIGGFIITGIHTKKIIVRAIGPSLPLAGVLADPILELHNSAGGLIFSNDNWRSIQEAQIIATGVPPGNDLESAIVATLQANGSSYTAVVRGVNDGTGIGVVEAYDLEPTVDSKLANISTRGFVQTGDNVLIGGLIVQGQNLLRVIVRAIGPSLPIPGALENPTLELHDSSGALIASNDNWRSDQQAEIIATGIPPLNDLESAIVRDLASGNYTAIVRGANGTTGIAVVEAYALN